MLQKFFVFILLLGLKINSSLAMEEPKKFPSNLTKIYVDGHVIYTAAVKLKNGEIAYLACEPIINEERKHKWFIYKSVTEYLVQHYFYPALLLAGRNELNSNIDKLFRTTKYNQEEFLKLAHQNANKKMLKAIKGIKSGCVGMYTDVGNYVTYISRKPVTGFLSLPSEETYDLDQYITNYNDIVMSVSSFHSDEDKEIYQHRGIFRNPMSMLRKDYPGLALLIHAFTGAVWHEEFPSIKFMTVEPDGNDYMRTLLLEEFNSEELRSTSSFGGIEDKEKYHQKFILNDQTFTVPNHLEEYAKSIVIKIEALAKRFATFNQKK